MVQAADQAGFGEVSERLVTDWVDKGLLDQPERLSRGRGGGAGARYEWPESQRDLFLLLLSKRGQVKRLAGLCPIPVGTWIYWNESWIPLRQVKRALRTWWDAASDAGRLERSHRGARVVVNSLVPNDDRKLKSALRKAVSDGIFAGGFDPERLRPLVEEIVQVIHGGSYGPFANTADELVRGLRAMSEAVARYDELTDAHFEEARARHRLAVLSYVRDFARLRADPEFGSSFEDPNIEFLMNNACRDLLLELGMLLLTADEGIILAPIEPLQWDRPPEVLLRLPERK